MRFTAMLSQLIIQSVFEQFVSTRIATLENGDLYGFFFHFHLYLVWN